MTCEPTDFRPPAREDRATALVAAADARGDLPEIPRCNGFPNGCKCHVCKSGNGRACKRARSAKPVSVGGGR